METHSCASGRGRGARVTRDVQRDERVPSRARHPGHQCPVGHLRHGALTEHPVRTVELGVHRGQRSGLLVRADTTRVDVRLPPPLPVRDESQGSVVTPVRLADRFRPPTGDRPCRPRSLQHLVVVCGAGTSAERQQQDGRGVPRHVRMVPGDHGQTVCGLVHPGGTEEIMPVEQDGLAGRAGQCREGDDAPEGSSRSLPMDLPHGQHPLAVRGGAQPTVIVDFAGRRWCAQRHRRDRTGRGSRSVTEPDPLVRLIDIREGAGGPSRNEAQRAAAVLVDPAPNAHCLRRVVGRAVRIGPHNHRPARLGRAGLQPIDRLAVRADFRERDLGSRHVLRRERRCPTPIPCRCGHGPNVPVATGPARRRQYRALQ